MANDLENASAALTKFAADHSMTIVPAVPGTGSDGVVRLDAEVLDLNGFLELARELGDGALYRRAEVFGTDLDTGQPEEVPADMASRKGQIGELRVAFASAGHGLLHFWEQSATWYQDWLDSQDDEDGDYFAEDRRIRQERAEDRERVVAEIAAAIIADPEFRASGPGARRRRAHLIFPDFLPEGTEHWVGRDGARQALEQAETLTDQTYRPIREQLDDLAAEFLASPSWQQSASATARKQAAAEFLIPRADGLCPPAPVRDELYAKAKRLSKAASTGLF